MSFGLHTFFHGTSCVLIFTRNLLGYILGDFFTNASGHPAPCVDSNLYQMGYLLWRQTRRHEWHAIKARMKNLFESKTNFLLGLTFSLSRQGCQIFLGTTYQKGEKSTKLLQNYKMPIKYTQWL
jgi:hypothetical protein